MVENICWICCKPKKVHRNRKTGQLVCNGCYHKEFQPKEECSLCGKIRRVVMRNNGQSVCPTCYCREFQPKEECLLCGRIRRVRIRTKKGKPFCDTCYKREFYRAPEEECSLCGQVRQVKIRRNSNPLCGVCYHREKVDICQECGEEKIIQAFGKCFACYQRQRRTKMAIPA